MTAKSRHSPWLVQLVTLMFMIMLGATTRVTYGRPQEPAKETKEQRKEREQREKRQRDSKKLEEKKTEIEAKVTGEFEKLKTFADELYQTNPQFIATVKDAYAAKRREHSEFAFVMNTRDESDERVTRTGDTFKIEDSLYDNPLVQQYVNRLGQFLVPESSENLYAFRVTLNPVPMSRALSTGTIYVSTGFISLAENEAQLAYILAHEIAHVEKNHWQHDVLMQVAQPEYAEAQKKKRTVWSRAASAAAGGVGFAGGGNITGIVAMSLIEQGLPTLIKLMSPGGVIGWDPTQEAEADQEALSYMLARNYDPEVVPRLFDNLLKLAKSESRASLGFIADPVRIKGSQQTLSAAAAQLKAGVAGRSLNIGAVDLPSDWEAGGRSSALALNTAVAPPRAAPVLTPEQRSKVASSDLVADSGRFKRVMAELKRDNGIQAYYYDMFTLSLKNLEEARAIYADDAMIHFAYGRTLWLTARTADQRGRAVEAFDAAATADRRNVLPQIRLYKALIMIDVGDPADRPNIGNSSRPLILGMILHLYFL